MQGRFISNSRDVPLGNCICRWWDAIVVYAKLLQADTHLTGMRACMAVYYYLQVKWFCSPLRYTCIRGISWWWCGVYDIMSCVQLYTTYFSQVQLCYYCIMLCLSVLLYCHRPCEWSFTHHIAFQFYTLFFRPEWCAAVSCTAVVRPQKGVPWIEPFTSSSNCYSTLQPSVFLLTLPALELVVITFMNLQQFGFIGECKFN